MVLLFLSFMYGVLQTYQGLYPEFIVTATDYTTDWYRGGGARFPGLVGEERGCLGINWGWKSRGFPVTP